LVLQYHIVINANIRQILWKWFVPISIIPNNYCNIYTIKCFLVTTRGVTGHRCWDQWLCE